MHLGRAGTPPADLIFSAGSLLGNYRLKTYILGRHILSKSTTVARV